jgi:hypothetical protein
MIKDLQININRQFIVLLMLKNQQ